MSNTLDGDLGKVYSSEFGLESKFGPVNSLMICNLGRKEYCGEKTGRPRQGEQSNTGITYMSAVVTNNGVFVPAAAAHKEASWPR